ncbi:DNA-binding transcriptional regulator, MerR family [Dehalogenimonas formicexedens]|uniref:DNA-binding transcriptional regulator, MerR family n=1 Tax=Dehalogenimonas formicexedens TaxID=1839801 RepID=A0A1P8F948_9CHLR|nr:MerR family transcriptional regulator [Dehalogenimonas formicexedens]APV44960.1 DNA-binding transcriptional regulator, MerR family [Dehalogenimonas formicexedens]
MAVARSYATGELAKVSGVSPRTLQFYDKIGLLKPESYSESGYRRYDDAAALRLQQILFFRELGFELSDIRAIMEKPDFDLLTALESHRELLRGKVARLGELLGTVDRTIQKLKGNKKMEIKDYYKGFSEKEVEAIRREAREKYGEKTIADSEAKVMAMGKQKWDALQAEFGEIYMNIVANMGKGPGSKEVQEQIGRWRQLMENFSHYTDEMILGLGRMYSEDERFAAFYLKFHPDMPKFMTAAIEHYTEQRKK